MIVRHLGAGEIARVLRPVRLQSERERQRPRRYVVKTVILFGLAFAPHLVAVETPHVVIDERLVLRRVLFEDRFDQHPLRLVQVDHVRPRGECARRRGSVLFHVAVGGRRSEWRSGDLHFDPRAAQNFDQLGRPDAVGVGQDHDALQLGSTVGVHALRAEIVEILQPLGFIFRRLFERRHRRDIVFRDRAAQGCDRTVLARPPEPLEPAAVRLVRHSDRAIQGRKRVPVSRIKKVEHVADVVVPTVRVERPSVRSAVYVEPFVRHGLREIWVDRQCRGREEKLRRLAVMVDGDLRVPVHERLLQIARLLLRHRQRVAVEVETEMVDAAVDAPRLSVLDGVAVGVAGRDRVVPRDEPFVPVGVLACNDEHDSVFQNVERRRFVRRGELVNDLHHRLERRRFVAVYRVRHPRDRGRRTGDRLGVGGTRPTRVRQPTDVRLDLVHAGDVLGRRDRNDMLHAVLVRLADVVYLHALGRGRRDGLDHAFHLGVCRVKIAHVETQYALRPRHVRAVFAAGVKVELLLGLGRRSGGAKRHQEQGENDLDLHSLFVGHTRESGMISDVYNIAVKY